MDNYSTTQATNLAAIAGVIVLLLNHFKINIASDEVTMLLGAVLAIGSIANNWYHRFQKGDLTLGGFRK